MEAVLRRDQAGEEGGAGRGADGIAAHCPGEEHSLGSQPIDIRSPDVLVAVAAEGPGAVVVGQDEDDVGPGRGCARVRQKEEKHQTRDQNSQEAHRRWTPFAASEFLCGESSGFSGNNLDGVCSLSISAVNSDTTSGYRSAMLFRSPMS